MDRPPAEKPLSLRADLLDPLVSLHWEKRNGVLAGVEGEHAHSVWFNGKLYVGGGGDDMFLSIVGSSVQLFVYSPSEDSWHVIPTPTYRYALATYHSQLVLVGGEDPTTRKPTSKVWLLEGCSWVPHPTVPDMPVSTSSSLGVAVGFSEYLIVSGRKQDHGSTAMSVFDGQKWLSAQALPEKLDEMKFAVNGDDWYLTGRNRRLYRTSLKSLVASAVSPAAQSAVWARLQDSPNANSGFTWFGNRLLAVGGGSSSTVYAYNLRSKVAWVPVSDLPDDVCRDSCCAVLPTGELLVIRGSKALLRATINVESEDDVSDLAELLIPEVAGHWQLFLGALGVSSGVRAQLQLKHPHCPKLCLLEGVEQWVVATDCPYEKIVRVLRGNICTNRPLAEKVEDFVRLKYGPPVANSEPSKKIKLEDSTGNSSGGGLLSLPPEARSLPSSVS